MKTQTVKVTVLASVYLSASPVSAQDGAPLQLADRVVEWRAGFAQWVSVAAEDHMSPVGMYLAADIVVQAVMVSLALASVLVWAVFLAKLLILLTARLRLRRNYRKLDKLGTLDLSPETFAKRRGVLGAMVRAAVAERVRSSGTSPAGIKERAESALARIEAGAARGMGAGTSVLAITGSTAPFIGLFGTVWGIMNSFVSIAETNTTNLAVVAPGIAEALLATAIGLVAAIPAVIFYNLLARGIGGYRVMLADASALVQRTLSRDLDLSEGQQIPPAEDRQVATVAGEDAPQHMIQQAAE